MWASLGMSQECANLVCGFGREDVLELAGLLLDLRFTFEGQTVGKQPFREPMASNDIRGPLASALCQLDNHAAVADRDAGWLEGIVAGIHERFVMVADRRMWRGFQQTHLAH